jgi:sugar fermentation stimulation protein A
MVAAGERAVMLFVVQRTDCDAFEACHDLDPAYAKGLTEAAARGVEVLAYACEISPQAVQIAGRIPWSGA